MSSDSIRILEYHNRTKHRPQAMARGPGRLDWDSQPDPFRSYQDTTEILLNKTGFSLARTTPAPLDIESLSQLFFESLALSAQKSFAGSRWSLRVNPSSGNLHPTECYLIAGPVAGLKGSSGIYHYSPKKHALEIRSEISAEAWNSLDLPEGAILLALSSIYWRESWKYGERAFRYCHLDIGHALAALDIAASCLGWQCKLQENVGTVDLIKLLGLSAENRDELEHPDGLMAAYPADQPTHPAVSSNQLRLLDPPGFLGRPNLLSQSHVNWPAIDDACQATTKPSTDPSYLRPSPGSNSIAPEFCKLLRQRRSAQAMDGRTSMSVANFWRILRAGS